MEMIHLETFPIRSRYFSPSQKPTPYLDLRFDLFHSPDHRSITDIAPVSTNSTQPLRYVSSCLTFQIGIICRSLLPPPSSSRSGLFHCIDKNRQIIVKYGSTPQLHLPYGTSRFKLHLTSPSWNVTDGFPFRSSAPDMERYVRRIVSLKCRPPRTRHLVYGPRNPPPPPSRCNRLVHRRLDPRLVR